jgi:hypothetical protein
MKIIYKLQINKAHTKEYVLLEINKILKNYLRHNHDDSFQMSFIRPVCQNDAFTTGKRRHVVA